MKWILDFAGKSSIATNRSPPLDHQVISGLLGVFLRAMETTIRQNSPDELFGKDSHISRDQATQMGMPYRTTLKKRRAP